MKLSFKEAAEILKDLLPGFKGGTFAPPAVERISLDEALEAYRAIVAGASGKKFVSRSSREEINLDFSFFAQAVLPTDELLVLLPTTQERERHG